MDDARSLLPPTDIGRRGFVASSLAVSGFALAAQPVQAQTIVTTSADGLEAGDISIPTSTGPIAGYRAAPATGTNLPVILVVQEIFGVHEHIKDVCRRFAKAGYYAIAPELFQRQGDVKTMTDIPAIIANVVSKVPDTQVMSDLDAATAFAKASGRADVAKLGVTGFCWGGRITWMYTAHNPAVKAGVAWYGALVRPANEMTPKHPIDIAPTLKTPVLGLYGAADTGIPNETVEQMRKALPAGGPSEIVLYPDTPHAFHADYRASYREAAAKDGWARALAWFKKHGVA
jgi:carboxymethylenebutenolidase